MAGQIPEDLQKKLTERLTFYEDLVIRLFYTDRRTIENLPAEPPLQSVATLPSPPAMLREEPTLPKINRKPDFQKAAAAAPPRMSPLPLPTSHGPSLFDATEKIKGDTLLRIREDLGECTR